jgi:hypothetical protein
MSILDQAKDFGVQQSQGRAVLPALAIAAAKAAEAGEIDEEDADKVYETYVKFARRITKVDMAAQATRAQVSKLRQIIKLGAERGTEPLMKAMRLHPEATKQGRTLPLYDSMVNVARAQLARPGVLKNDQIVLLMQFPKGRRGR